MNISFLIPLPNYRHRPHSCQVMMTSSNGNIFRVTGHLCGEFTGPGEFPAQRPVTRSFDIFFDLRLYKRLSKQSWGWWFETLSCSLWRHCNVTVQLALPGSFISHCLVYHKAWNAASSESFFSQFILMYIILVHRSFPLVSIFYVYSTTISLYIPRESTTENFIFDRYLPALTQHLAIPAENVYFTTVTS